MAGISHSSAIKSHLFGVKLGKKIACPRQAPIPAAVSTVEVMTGCAVGDSYFIDTAGMVRLPSSLTSKQK